MRSSARSTRVRLTRAEIESMREAGQDPRVRESFDAAERRYREWLAAQGEAGEPRLRAAYWRFLADLRTLFGDPPPPLDIEPHGDYRL